jgi:hypothetical protein
VEPELHFADATCAISTVGNSFVNVLRRPATLEMIEEIRRQVQRHFRRCNGVTLALSVLEPGAAQSVPRDVREKSAKLTTDFPSLAAATVIEGSGFRAAATRTAVTTMFLFARPPYPYKVFGDLAEGASWVIETGKRGAPLSVTADDLVRAVAEARRAIAA